MGLKAVKSFHVKTDQLLRLFPKPTSPALWNQQVSYREQYVCAYCIIDLNDLWSDFCRTLVLALASGRAIDSKRNRFVAAHAYTEKEALKLVVNSRGHEPKWHNALEACRALDNLNAPNKTNAKMALSAVSSPATEINTVRNYFAHRKSDCRQKLMSASFYHRTMQLDPYRIGNFLRQDGRSNIQFWIDELRIISWACIN